MDMQGRIKTLEEENESLKQELAGCKTSVDNYKKQLSMYRKMIAELTNRKLSSKPPALHSSLSVERFSSSLYPATPLIAKDPREATTITSSFSKTQNSVVKAKSPSNERTEGKSYLTENV